MVAASRGVEGTPLQHKEHGMTRKSTRLILAACLLGVTAIGIVALATPSSQAAPAGNCTYYNNANHSKVVGQFGYDCCNNYVAWGTRTSYYVCGGCFICFPPNP
jgi:hypothetical protein